MTNPILAKIKKVNHTICDLEKQSGESDSVKFREKTEREIATLRGKIKAIKLECKHPGGRKVGYSFTCPDCGYSVDDEPYCHAHPD